MIRAKRSTRSSTSLRAAPNKQTKTQTRKQQQQHQHPFYCEFPPKNNNMTTTTTTTTAATAPATTYEEALEDVHTRFILNLPPSELQTADRIFFQLEQAWWFYEDWICDPHPEWNLPRFATFKPFAAKLFEYSPLLHSGGDDSTSQSFAAMWNAFSNYKRKISNYGCILLNAACTHAVLCRVWNGKSYTFPAGKINQNEDGKAAAARETYEETGFDPLCKFGITASWKQQQQQQQQSTTTTKMITWKDTISEQDALVFTEENGKRRTAYVVVGVPEDFPFEPVARKEVSSVAFFPLDDLPKSSYGVIPFLGPLRRWIRKYCKANGIPVPTTTTAAVQQQQQRKTPNRSRGRSSRGRNNNNNSQGRQGSTGRGRRLPNEQDDLVATGLLASAGQEAGWSEEEMFRVNEALLGRRVEYDGNPHVFTDQGCGGDGGDPHAFRVVGGTFLNAAAGDNGTTTNNNNNNNNSAGQTTTLLAPPPDRSKMQPLFRQGSNESNNNNNDDDNDNKKKKKSTGPELTPFFSHDGATPWGDVVEEARGVDNFKSPGRSASRTKKQQRSKKKKKKQQQQQQQPSKSGDAAVSDEDDEADDAVFMTDAQITAKSQKSKTSIQSYTQYRQQLEREYQQDLAHIQQWVANLPKPKPTKRFGEFKLDVDRIMAAVTPILQLTPDEL